MPEVAMAPLAADPAPIGPLAGPMQRFGDVTVVPAVTLERGGVPLGGPVWPRFRSQLAARHCREGRAVDRRPEAPETVEAVLGGPTVWGGVARCHFGHLVSEFTTRLPQSLAERPSDRYLFLLDAGESAQSVPSYVWAVLDWYGVPRPQVAFVERPMRVKVLRVAPQGEQMNTVGPSAAYLDLLDANLRRRDLAAEPSDILYVARAGLCALGLGGHAGEGYLVSLLRELGVQVMDPAAVDLRTQLARYAGAKTIVFAEGSAIHGRQLLGRIDQRIVVLVRRPGKRLALPHLQPRCRELDYVEAGRNVMLPVRAQGPNPVIGMAFYDPDALAAAFAGLGVDLRRHWDEAAYRAACEMDVAGWMRVRLDRRENYLPRPTRLALSEALAAEGLAHMEIPIHAAWKRALHL
jgi:hypothetical protein